MSDKEITYKERTKYYSYDFYYGDEFIATAIQCSNSRYMIYPESVKRIVFGDTLEDLKDNLQYIIHD